MPCPDCGGTSTVELVSILLAAGAFAASIASLWLTSMRWPRVEVEHVAADHDLEHGATTDGIPHMQRLTLSILVYNTGAGATVVRDFVADGFRENSTGARLFAGIGPPPTPDLEMALVLARRAGIEPPPAPDLEEPLGPDLEMPLVLERDDAERGQFVLGLKLSNDLISPWTPDFTIGDPEEYARRLGALRSVSMTLRWSFIGRRFPRVRQRVWVPAQKPVTVDATAYRQRVIRQWRMNDATAPLADIAEEVAGWRGG